MNIKITLDKKYADLIRQLSPNGKLILQNDLLNELIDRVHMIARMETQQQDQGQLIFDIIDDQGED